MTSSPFAALRAVPATCPSDLSLDRLVQGELEHEEKRKVEQHCAECQGCQARVKALRRGFDAFPSLDAAALLQRIEASRPEESKTWGVRLRAWFEAHVRGVSSLSLVTVASLLLVLHFQDSEDGGSQAAPSTRLKGGLSLHVYRQRGTGSQRMTSGERFHAGDKLRFQVDMPSDGYVLIVGVEADGDLYAAWPTAPGAAASKLSAGAGQLLPGAVELDAARGKEALFLVQCSQPFAARQCSSTGAGHAPRCADGCRLSPFVLDKQP